MKKLILVLALLFLVCKIYADDFIYVHEYYNNNAVIAIRKSKITHVKVYDTGFKVVVHIAYGINQGITISETFKCVMDKIKE